MDDATMTAPRGLTLSESRRDLRVMALGSLLYMSGCAMFYIVPPWLAFVGQKLALDSAQLGTMAAVESAAIGLSSLTAPFWIGRVNWRFAIVVAVLVCIVGNLVAALNLDFGTFLLSRAVIGLLGEGVLYTLAFGVLGSARNVDRAFAAGLTTAVIFGAVVTLASSSLTQVFPAIGPLSALIAAAVVILPFVGWWSGKPGQTPGAATAAVPSRRQLWLPILALVAQGVWFISPGAFWSFSELVALNKGMPVATAEFGLAIAQFVGLIGCFVPALLGDRFGRFKPVLVSTIAMLACAVAYQYSGGLMALIVLLGAYYAVWNYGCVYQYSFVNDLDRSGRLAVVMPAVNVFGMSVGPYIAGSLMLEHGDGAVTLTALIFGVIGMGLYAISFYRARAA